MSDDDSIQLNPTRPKDLYKCHSNVSREIALVDFLNNDGDVVPDVVFQGVKEGVTIHDREDMYRMGKKQELKVAGIEQDDLDIDCLLQLSVTIDPSRH